MTLNKRAQKLTAGCSAMIVLLALLISPAAPYLPVYFNTTECNKNAICKDQFVT
jgi:hypothetical protein